MSTINGLKTISATSIQNQFDFQLGNNLDSGVAGQVLTSGGVNEQSSWTTPILPITYTGGFGIDVIGSVILTDNDGTTINNTGGLGTQNQVLKVPNDLTINGTIFNGSLPQTITTPDTQLSLVGTAPVTIASVGLVRTIGVDFDDDTIVLDGSDLSVDHVPEELTFTGTSTGTFDGSAALTINLTDTNTTYAAGDNINISGPGNDINLDTAITAMTDITYDSGFYDSTLYGNDYPSKPTICSYLDLTGPSNIILPQNCFYEPISKEYRLAFNQGIFIPNDDNLYYNIAVEDDSSTYIHGRVKPQTSALELVGFITIPNGWRATQGLLSLVGSTGLSVTRTTQYQNVRTWGGTGFLTMGYGSTNSVTTFGSTMDGAVDRVLMLKVYTSSTADYVGGGYIKIIKI